MNKQKVIVHIGYSKTGTSFLQNHYFPKISNVNYIKKKEILTQIIKYNPLKINTLQQGLFQDAQDMTLLLSYEMLIGSPFNGGLNLNLTKNNADKIKTLFPHAKIILFIRNQINIIASSYCQYVYGGGTWNLKNYLFHPSRKGPNALMLFDFDFFNYKNLIDYYSGLFGSENVNIYLYEEFKDNNYNFLHTFSNFYGFNIDDSLLKKIQLIHDQKSYSKSLIKLARILNLFTSRAVLNKYYVIDIPGFYGFSRKLLHQANMKLAGKMIPLNILKQEITGYISDYYKESNTKLMKEYKLFDMEKYKYPLL